MSGNTRAILYRIAWILLLITMIGLIIAGIAIAISEDSASGLLAWIPLIWVGVMTWLTYNAYTHAGFSSEQGHSILGVLEFIFSGIVPGILVIIATSGFSAINREDPFITAGSNDMKDLLNKD